MLSCRSLRGQRGRGGLVVVSRSFWWMRGGCKMMRWGLTVVREVRLVDSRVFVYVGNKRSDGWLWI